MHPLQLDLMSLKPFPNAWVDVDADLVMVDALSCARSRSWHAGK